MPCSSSPWHTSSAARPAAREYQTEYLMAWGWWNVPDTDPANRDRTIKDDGWGDGDSAVLYFGGW